MPSSMNDFQILRLYLYQKTIFEIMFNFEHGSQIGIHPYLIGDKGYLFLLWLMIPHKKFVNTRHTILKATFNKHLSKGRNIVENAFGIVKKTFRELLLKSNLHLIFLPSVVICCCMLHHLILEGKL